MQHRHTLALFDFDGTLTRGDSLLRFLLFAVPFPVLVMKSVVLFFRFFGMIWSGRWSAHRGKELLMAEMFGGRSLEDLQAMGMAFHRKKIPGLLRPDIMAALRDFKNSGADVAVVSASPDLWLAPFCEEESIVLICTELLYENGVFTGKLKTPNCSGHEKARRIGEVFQLEQYTRIVAYGNTAADAEMLMLAHEAHWVK